VLPTHQEWQRHADVISALPLPRTPKTLHMIQTVGASSVIPAESVAGQCIAQPGLNR
jgi:hypothetical protein